MNQILDILLLPLNFLFSERWIAPLILLPLMLLAAGWLHSMALRRSRPYLAAARERIAILRAALGEDSDPIAERAAFASDFDRVSQAMNADGPGTHELIQAWREFHETIVDETISPIRNTNRPGTYFHRAAPRQTTLTFASNVFVAVGLILTFLGLIVALNTAAKGMSGGDVAAAQLSLVGLLTVAGAKFFTSVAGLGASIWLRFAEHSLSRRVRHETELICQLLERGLLYVPPQRFDDPPELSTIGAKMLRLRRSLRLGRGSHRHSRLRRSGRGSSLLDRQACRRDPSFPTSTKTSTPHRRFP